jgi:hypothetical protein
MEEKKYFVKFYVFLGREKNMKILHSYIELGLKKNIIDEYHMFDFSKDINDHNFIYNEYNRLFSIYSNRIQLHNYNENNIYLLKDKKKIDWSPFYKFISSNTKDNDIIIKCDDDILFIDIYQLEEAIIDRYNDKESFLIHSNCINNGVCAYYQSELFQNLKDQLNVYPKGGILGILFEKPEIANALHIYFTKDLLSSIDNINNYFIPNKYINSRISINFILINGSDVKYLSNVSHNDEYELSSFIPETLCRHNKIFGALITSHLSYNFQEKFILKNNNIINNYIKIRDIYVNYNRNLPSHLFSKQIENNIPFKCYNIDNNIYKVKNWIKYNHFYIKNIETNKYLYIDYEVDKLILSYDKKTLFDITKLNNNIIIINLGIYYFNRYNCITNFRNENILIKCYNDNNEKYILCEDIDENNIFYFKFCKYNNYLGINIKDNNCIDITSSKTYKWIIENANITEDYIYVSRFTKNNKIYYQNIDTKEIYTNYYMGWGLENLLW